MDFSVRFAEEKDMPEVLDLIRELAIFEKEPNAVTIGVEELRIYGFGDHPKFNCFVAELHGDVVGMALVYERFSTWSGPVLHLEDLIVKGDNRGQGIGSALLDAVVNFGHNQNVKRITWVVLNWNTPAIEFYKKKGAILDSEWDSVSLDKEGIENYLAQI